MGFVLKPKFDVTDYELHGLEEKLELIVTDSDIDDERWRFVRSRRKRLHAEGS